MSDTEDFEDGYADAPDSAVGTVRVGKTVYAVALIWQEADDDTDPAAAARTVAADTTVNGDFFVLRPQSRQFGIGLKEKGHAKNMPSLGGHLAESRRGTQASWVGLLQVEGGFYVIAVRDELVLAQTDRFYADESQARAELDNLLALDDWGEVFAPASFGYPESTDRRLEQLVSGKPPRLRDIDKMGALARWGAGALVLGVILFGGLYYQNHLNELAIIAEEEAREALARTAGPLGGAEPVIQIPPMPWEGKPKAAEYLNACLASMHKAVLDFPGWTSESIECDANGNVVLEIKRSAGLEQGGGTVNWIRWTLDRSPTMAGASIVPSGKESDGATISWKGEKLDTYPPELNPRAPDIGKSRFYMQSWFEEAFTTISFPKAAQNDFYRSVSFTFSTGYEPTQFSAILGRVPGLTIDKVSADLKKMPMTYVVEGSIHEQLPPPKNARRAGAPGAVADAGATPAAQPRN